MHFKLIRLDQLRHL